jgi:WD40 repeat protein
LHFVRQRLCSQQHLLVKINMATPLKPIECSAQPLCISFHPCKDIVAAGLVDGTVEVHDLHVKKHSGNGADDHAMSSGNEDEIDDEEEEDDTILSTIFVAKQTSATFSSASTTAASPSKKATQGPSCRDVLFSGATNSPAASATKQPTNQTSGGGEFLFTVCNGGSLRCLDSELACSLLDDNSSDVASSPAILWSIENAHNVGINKLYQLPYNSPCGPILATGDDIGTVRLWDTRMCASQKANSGNPFDNLMKPPRGCLQQWKINHDYITDFTSNDDGTSLLATCADGKLSVFDMRYVKRTGCSKSIVLPDLDPNWDPTQNQPQQQNIKSSTWETHGYTQSENQEDELLSCAFIKKSSKLVCGTQEGILSLFSKDIWCDVSDRYPGHPQSIDAILKIDEDTVLTGSSDGLVRAVQLLPNSLLGVLGGHDGFPVEALGWSAGRKMVGSVSHDEYIRLWVSFEGGVENCE